MASGDECLLILVTNPNIVVPTLRHGLNVHGCKAPRSARALGKRSTYDRKRGPSDVQEVALGSLCLAWFGFG